MTTVHPGLHPVRPSEIDPDSLADLVADCADVSSHVPHVPLPRGGDMPHPRPVVTIPERAVALVAGLAPYGA